MKISLCGDIALWGIDAQMTIEGKGRILDQRLYDKLRNTDIFIANVECPLTDTEQPHWTYFPTLKGPRSAVRFLSDLGVTIGSLANNHIADYGLRGLEDTLSALEEKGILTVGAGRTPEEADRPVLVKREGMSIAVIALAQPEIAAARHGRWGSGVLSENKLILQIEKLKEDADIIIAYLHFGVEWFHYPTPHQVRLCRAAIDAGAKLVIGHHPHVPQGFEYYKDGFIAYSLGNFIFDMPAGSHKFSRLGLIIEAEFDKKSLININIVPLYTQKGIAKLLDNEDNREAFDYLAALSTPLRNRKELTRNYYHTCLGNFNIHRNAFLYYSFGKLNIRRLKELIMSQFWPQIFALRIDLLRFLLSGEAWMIESSRASMPSSAESAIWRLICRLSSLIGIGWGRILKVS